MCIIKTFLSCYLIFIKVTCLLLLGVRRFANDIHEMLGFRPGVFWMVCWAGISPVFLFVSISDGLLEPGGGALPCPPLCKFY